jgi:2-oxoglutarate ferredoxin oxidoreductase subunit beta
VTYNKLNTHQWFKAKTYYLDPSHDPHDRIEALRRASEVEKLPLGIFYLNARPTFEEKLSVYRESKDPLYKRSPDLKKLPELINAKRGL